MAALDDENEFIKYHNSQILELTKARAANQDNFDKSIITLASFSLGLSLSFLKDFLPIHRAEWPWMLYASWILFTASILSTLISFRVSDTVFLQHRDELEKVFDDENAVFNEKVPAQKYARFLNIISASCFFFALVFTVSFVIPNLPVAAKYKEGLCKDSKGEYGLCKLPTAQPQPADIGRDNPGPVLRNDVSINLVDNKPKQVTEPAAKIDNPNTGTAANMQNTVMITLPLVSKTIVRTVERVPKKVVCNPCLIPVGEPPKHCPDKTVLGVTPGC